MSRLTRDGTAEPVSRDQILSRVQGQGNINFACSADHEQDFGNLTPVDPYPCHMCDGYAYIYTVYVVANQIRTWSAGKENIQLIVIVPVSYIVVCARTTKL